MPKLRSLCILIVATCSWNICIGFTLPTLTKKKAKKEKSLLSESSHFSDEPPEDRCWENLAAIENDGDISKMEELETALSKFLQDATEVSSLAKPQPPLPPAAPPPLAALGIKLVGDAEEDELLVKNAEKALQTIRQRLKKEEESLRQAEQLLKKSLQEEEVLKRAELVLKKSREAAEKRKAEAIRLTDAAAKKAKITKTAAEKIGQDIGRATRSTVSLTDLNYFQGEDRGGLAASNSNNNAGIPKLYNWTQDMNGCIQGCVRGSDIFRDGDIVSTSPVPLGVQPNSTVTTSSGSKYYLEAINNIRSKNNSDLKMDKLDETPSIKNWVLLEDGGISGLIYGSSNANDGDYVETSPVAIGNIENGSIVTTKSGSQYFLSLDGADGVAKALDISSKRGGTITIPKVAKMPRSTFSLANLGFNFEALRGGKKAPKGIPTLSDWSINKDGTLTGVITGSRNIEDGDLVTTSPVIGGERKRFETVTTRSGSVYFLG